MFVEVLDIAKPVSEVQQVASVLIEHRQELVAVLGSEKRL